MQIQFFLTSTEPLFVLPGKCLLPRSCSATKILCNVFVVVVTAVLNKNNTEYIKKFTTKLFLVREGFPFAGQIDWCWIRVDLWVKIGAWKCYFACMNSLMFSNIFFPRETRATIWTWKRLLSRMSSLMINKSCFPCKMFPTHRTSIWLLPRVGSPVA